MKKLAFLMALILIVSIPVSANAATVRMVDIYPSITFQDDVAYCSIAFYGDSQSDQITARIKLYEDGVFKAAWPVSGYGSFTFSRQAYATRGCTYTLVVEATINGVERSPYSITKTYN